MAFKNYDPRQFIITFKEALLQGFAAGTFISVERDEDTYEATAGSDGDVTRVRKHNKMGTVTVTIKAESPTNDLLSQYAKDDELSGSGVGEIMVKNLNGTTQINGAHAWIKKFPTVEGADDSSDREWIFGVAELEMFVGGAVT